MLYVYLLKLPMPHGNPFPDHMQGHGGSLKQNWNVVLSEQETVSAEWHKAQLFSVITMVVPNACDAPPGCIW